jgi:hypothetical protein
MGYYRKDWHMYSQFTPEGPLALEVIFKIRKIILVLLESQRKQNNNRLQ